MLKVLVACGNHAGTSLLISNKAQKTFQKLGIEAKFHDCTLEEAFALLQDYDLILTPQDLVKEFSNSGSQTLVIGLRNVLSETELISKLRLYNIIK